MPSAMGRRCDNNRSEKDGRKLKTIGIRFKTSSKLDRNKIKYYQRFQNLNGSIDIYCKKFLSTHLLQLIHHRFPRNICVYASGYWYSLNKSKSLNIFLVLGKDKTPPTIYRFENGEEDKKGQVGIICKQILYNKMHEIYAFSKHNIAHNNHKNVFCSRPHPYYSKLFSYKYYNEGKLNLSVSTDELESEETDSPL